jgi:hypothetical protein
VQTCVCFAAPAELYGEVVGAAVVPKPGEAPPTLAEVQAGLRTDFSARWRPQLLVLMPAIPKGPTGKPKRIGLAQELQLPRLREKEQPTYTVRHEGGQLRLCDAHGEPLWPASQLRVTLVLDADRPEAQSRHELRLLESAEPGAAAGVEARLELTTYASGAPATRELPITADEAQQALACARRRKEERGSSWVSLRAAPPAVAHDFCGWLEVAALETGEILLRHEWQPDCADTPPGKLMRLLKAVPPPVAGEGERKAG